MYSNCDTCSHKTSAGCATRPEIVVDKISLQDVCLSYAGKVEITEQVAKADNGKPKLTLVPRKIIFAIAKIREYGTKKYHDPDNWKNVEKERYRDAAYRHFMAYLEEPTGVDEESGLPHLWHLACNIAFLCEMENITE